MTTKRSREIFINLPVRDLAKSMAFFKTLDFEFNAQFTDEKAACMIINDHAYAMLITEPFFKTFTTKELCDTSRHSEGLFAFSVESREAVSALVKTAFEAGATPAMPPVDLGFMYYETFHDLDGHHWEVLWMDDAASQNGPPGA